MGEVIGDVRVLLSGERTALNYLQRMSGIATYTNNVVKLLEGSKIKLLDTRKQLLICVFLKNMQLKWEGEIIIVTNLPDGILLKDNHINAAGGVAKAIKMAKEYAPFVKKN